MAATPTGSIATAQASQGLATVLVWAHVGSSWHQSGGDLHTLREFGTPRLAGRGFYITPRRLWRRPTTRGNRGHGALELDSTPYKRHPIAGADLVGRLHTLAVEMHLATGDSLCSQGARLEQAHAKEPAVESRRTGAVFCAIFGHGREYN